MSDLYYDTYNEGQAPEETGKTALLLRRILTAAVATAIGLMMLFLFYRMWEMKEPPSVGKLLLPESARALHDSADVSGSVRAPYDDATLYSFEKEDLTTVTLTKKTTDESGALRYETLTLPRSEYYEVSPFRAYTANTGSYTVTDEKGKETTIKRTGYYEAPGSPVEGALRVSNSFFLPECSLVQFTFRHKSDVLDKLGGVPGLDGSVFTCALRDDKGNVYTAYRYRLASRGVYRYTTMLFENVSFAGVHEWTLELTYLDPSGKAQTLSLSVYDDSLPLSVKPLPDSVFDSAESAEKAAKHE